MKSPTSKQLQQLKELKYIGQAPKSMDQAAAAISVLKDGSGNMRGELAIADVASRERRSTGVGYSNLSTAAILIAILFTITFTVFRVFS